jgi:hypothetical protein
MSGKPLGSVLYDETATLAELWPDGHWTVKRLGVVDDAAGRSLERYYRNEYGPADGNPDRLALEDLVQRTDGTLYDDDFPVSSGPLVIN